LCGFELGDAAQVALDDRFHALQRCLRARVASLGLLHARIGYTEPSLGLCELLLELRGTQPHQGRTGRNAIAVVHEHFDDAARDLGVDFRLIASDDRPRQALLEGQRSLADLDGFDGGDGLLVGVEVCAFRGIARRQQQRSRSSGHPR
jgi:hypothetical protein